MSEKLHESLSIEGQNSSPSEPAASTTAVALTMAAEPPHPDLAASDVEEKAEDAGSNFKYYFRVFTYNDGPGWTLNIVAFVCMIASGVVLPLMNVVFGNFINSFNQFAAGELSPSKYRDSVGHFALYFVYLFIAKFGLVYVWSVLISLTGIRAVKALRVDFIRSTLRQEIPFFDSSNASISSQITANGNLVYGGISEKLGLTIQGISTFLAAFIVAFVVQWKLTLIVCCIVPVNIAVTAVAVKFDTALELGMYKHYSEADALVEEALSTIKTAHAYWAFPKLSRRFTGLLAEAKKIGDKKTWLYVIAFPSDFFCVFAGYGLAFWQGIHLYSSGEISEPGTVVTVILAMLVASQALTQIVPQTIAVSKAAAAAQDLFTVIDRKSAVDSFSDEGLTIPAVQGHLQLQGVNFAYPSRPDVPILEDFSLDIPAGKTTALVGASGSGKSTIIGLVERWYTSQHGTITMDGHRIEDLKLSWLRTTVRLVQQEPTLFSGTIFQNVVDGLTGTTMTSLAESEKRKLVEEACQAAFAHDFIQDLPQGYDTWIGERGGSLSGGQKQRIVIARSIISDPKVLLLDEATSALDPHAEKIVQRALNNVGKSRTMVVIAHRLSTIRDADNIIVMSKGKVVEQGTHDELLSRTDSSYAKLVKAQDLGHGKDGTESNSLEGEEEEEEPKGTHHGNQETDAVGDVEAAEDDITAVLDKSVSHGLLKGIYVILKEQKPLMIPAIATLICAIMAGATYPALAVVFSKTMIAFQDVDVSRGNFFALMFFVIALGNLVAYAIAGWAANAIAQHIMKEYRAETFANTIRQDMTFFDRPENSTGALASRVASETGNLQELLSFNLFLILINCVSLISSSILAIAYGWKLGLVLTFGGLPILVGSGYVRIRLEYRFDDDAAARFSKSSGYASEAVLAIRTVSSLALEHVIVDRYHDLLKNLARDASTSLGWKMFFYSLSQSISFLVMGLGFWYGGRLVSTGEYSTLQFYTVFIAVIFSGEAAAMLFQYTTSITKAQVAMNYMFTLRKNRVCFDPSEPSQHSLDWTDEKSADPKANKSKEMVLDNVGFAYAQRPEIQVLEGIDATISPGKVVALVGASGCGKSTIISLLERFYDTTSGEIRADGMDIKSYDRCLYRRDIALVQQEPVLYQGSIRDNISLGIENGDPDETAIIAACREANIWDFVSSLPEGLNTKCGSQGLSLSGGQRQRVSIARALIRQPRLLLLDEATSALDTESEKVVKEALDRAAEGRTTVAVAHRLSTIRDADAILVLGKGRVTERGTHSELVAKKGMYYEMVMGQALDREATYANRVSPPQLRP